jgi:hypothetical protein
MIGGIQWPLWRTRSRQEGARSRACGSQVRALPCVHARAARERRCVCACAVKSSDIIRRTQHVHACVGNERLGILTRMWLSFLTLYNSRALSLSRDPHMVDDNVRAPVHARTHTRERGAQCIEACNCVRVYPLPLFSPRRPSARKKEKRNITISIFHV